MPESIFPSINRNSKLQLKSRKDCLVLRTECFRWGSLLRYRILFFTRYQLNFLFPAGTFHNFKSLVIQFSGLAWEWTKPNPVPRVIRIKNWRKDRLIKTTKILKTFLSQEKVVRNPKVSLGKHEIFYKMPSLMGIIWGKLY